MADWREGATFVTEHHPDWRGYSLPVVGLLAEDDYGDLFVPSFRRRGWWVARLDARKPWHWPSYLRSRLTGRMAMVGA
jgi:hypothetical protein